MKKSTFLLLAFIDTIYCKAHDTTNYERFY